MIETGTSIQLKEQLKTNNRPIVAICRSSQGLGTYYLKYMRGDNEADGLLSEIVCQRLAKRAHLNTPDIALIEISNHPNDIYKLESGMKVFGSKRVDNAEELSQHNFVLSKHDFNRLEYPPHILKIGMFDAWIGNTDRSDENFNLLLSHGKKQKLYVFDHFNAFSNIIDRKQDSISLTVDVYDGFLGSSYGYNMLGWVKKSKLKHERDRFFNFVHSSKVNIFLHEVRQNIPPSWNISDKTINYIKRYLTNRRRLKSLKKGIDNYIKYLNPKL